MQLIGGGGRESTNLLGVLNIPWKGFERKTLTKHKAHAGMAERLVRYLDWTGSSEGNKKQGENINQSYGEWCAQTGKGVKYLFYLTLYKIIKYTKHFQNVCITPQPAIFVVDCCQFGPSWMFGLKTELMACADLVGSTTEQSCIFPHLKSYYQWY